ncbi:MAG: RNA methyltransferase [Candidatus Nezhaarchaeales archaeon]
MIIRVVMVEPEKGGNVGSVARVMKNFGIKQLYLVNPKAQLSEARPYAAHAIDVLESAVVVSSLQEALDGVSIVIGSTAVSARSPSNLTRITVFPEELARYLLRYESGIAALLLGRESIGLLNKELELCDVIVTIPAASEYPVLNVAMAAGIILYELYKAFNVRQKASYAKPADRRVIEIIVSYFESLLRASGLEGARLKLTVKSLRNVLGRSFLASREASLLAGGFRRLWLKLQSQGLD